jgi:formylglycine-generating enzyme required for sulfatase activity
MKPVAIVVSMLIAAILMAGCSFWEDLPVEKEQETDTTVSLIHLGGMVLVKAKDSSFRMGSTQGSGSQPVQVSFTYDFWVDTTEVTQEKFDSVMKAAYTNYDTGSWEHSFGAGVRYPALGRNWYDAVLYCNALSKKERFDTVYLFDSLFGTIGNGCGLNITGIDILKTGYRLPTEAEWEYACRAGATGEFYWGSETAQNYAWYSVNAGDKSHPVAQKKPNDFGLYDMSGNLWEWCCDWYAEKYPDSAKINPVVLTGVFSVRVIRGGCWTSESNGISSSTRFYQSPSYRQEHTGFRTVRKKL